MFEDDTKVNNYINPESINPHHVQRPQQKDKEEYEDTPEYRKSLNMKVPPLSNLSELIIQITKFIIIGS